MFQFFHTFRLGFLYLFLFWGSLSLQAQLYLNEVMTSNEQAYASSAGFVDWVEVYNAGTQAVDLQGYALSDASNEASKGLIPASTPAQSIVPPGGYLLLFLDGRSDLGANHLDFQLSRGGEMLYLFSPDSSVILDSVCVPLIPVDFSYGRLTDGATAWNAFSQSSPMQSNTTGQKKLAAPVFSQKGGIFQSSQTISLSAQSGAQIYYSLDGTEPTSQSSLYSGPINIDTTTSLRARAFLTNWDSSLISTEAFVFNDSTSLPIIYLAIDPYDLWDADSGIYVKGSSNYPGDCGSGNYHAPWERPVSLHYFDTTANIAFQLEAGISIFGNCTRNFAMKSLQVATKKAYLSPEIPYPIFPTLEADEYRRVRLRSGGNHWKTSILGEAISHQLVEGKIDIETQSLQSTVVYLNEDYWGIHNMRHNYSEHYFRYKFPQYDTCDFDIVRPQRRHSQYFVASGTQDSMAALFNYFESHSPFTATDYQWAQQRIDLSEWINYYALQMWLYPGDWPNTYSPTNMIYWRPRTPEGKWRMAVLDTDQGWANAGHNTVSYMLNPSSNTSARNSEKATVLFRRLMEVPDFRNEFIQRYATQLNLLFNPTRTNQIIDSCTAIIAPEMAQHTAKWGSQGGVSSPSAWQTQVGNLKNFANVRSANVFQNLRDAYNLGGYWQLSIPIDSNAHGRVLLNQNGYPAPYQYQGQYLDSIPLLIKASPKPGYRFSHWLETGETNPTLSLSTQTDLIRTPVFVKAFDVLINEIHYKPSAGGEYEFIEIYNPDSLAWDLSGYRFTNGIDYAFPAGVVIEPDAYLLLGRDTALITAAPNVWKRNWTSGKLSGSERLELSNPLGEIIDQVKYDNQAPWPENISELEGSLQLADARTDNAQASNWLNACPSPGSPNLGTCSTLPIVINEIYYEDQVINTGDWVELYNPNATAQDLSNWQLLDRSGIFTFPPGTLIPAQSYLVLASDTLQFRLYYPQISHLLGPLDFQISGKGETLSLLADDCCVVDVVPMDNQSPWPESADGEGYSLSLLADSLNNYLASNWLASPNFGGSPAAPNFPSCQISQAESRILINEINYRSNPAADAGDWIELYNPGLISVDLSAWEIHDGDGYYQFPAGTTISADGYLVVAQDLQKFNVIFPYAVNGLGDWNFGFSGDGERIVLLNQNRCLIDEVRYNDSPPWPVEADGQGPTLALMAATLDNSLAGSWAPSTWGGALTGTPGMANQIPAPCTANPTSILISEISYRSADTADAGNWLELYNPSNQTVDLSAWMLMDEDSVYTFPAGTNIGAQDYLIVAEDIGAFQSQFPTITSRLIGSSKLNFNNGGERLLLYSDTRCLIDSLLYDNQFPWPLSLAEDQTTTIALMDLNWDNALGQHWGISSSSPATPNQLNCLPWLSVSPPALWYKADQSLADGTSVPQWGDQSANGRDALTLSPNTQPQYGQDTLNGNDWLNFDGQSQYFYLDDVASLLNDSCTIIALHANESGQGGSVLSSSEGGFEITYDEEGYLLYPNRQKITAETYDREPIITSYQYVPTQSIKTRVNGKLVGSLKLKEALSSADSVFIARSQGLAADTIIWLEAECGQRGSKFQALIDASASNGGYLEIQSGNNDYNSPGDTSKQVHYSFKLSKAGSYRAYGLVRAPNGSDDSFWVKIDNSSWARWNGIQKNNNFIWDQIHDELNGSQGVVWNLSAGEHTLSIASREDGTRLDKLLITNQILSPSGQGGQANNCEGAGAEQFWQGSVAELMIFPRLLNDAELAGVESYLGLKYGLSVANPQLLDSPWLMHQGGIGRDDRMCLEQLSSQNIDSSALVRFTAESTLEQGAYLLWGTNGASLDTNQAKLDVPAGIQKRLARTWFVQAPLLNSSLTLAIDLRGSNGPINELPAWQLLVSEDSNFSEAQIWTGDSLSLVNGILQVYGLEASQSLYFSLGLQEYVQISAKAILTAAWEASNGLMRDDLRLGDWLPLDDPYIGERSVADHVLDISGPKAVVDWVMLELRSSSDSSLVLWQEPLLIARDGSLLDIYGDSTLYLPIKAGYYFVSLRHRNHLGVMTAGATYLSQSATDFDFRSLTTLGIHAQKLLSSGQYGLWGGDSNGDGQLIFQGANNDPTKIFLDVMSAPSNSTFARNYVISGYLNGDINLDGQLIFQGGSTDVSPIFINVLTYPLNTSFARNYVFSAQLP